MPVLNDYDDTVMFFAAKAFRRSGTSYTKGQNIAGARTWKNLESMVRTHHIVPVTADRNLQPKMWLREIRSQHYCTVKYGFTPNISTIGDYTPGEHTVAQVETYAAAHPSELGRILVEEVAGANRSTLVTSLTASAKAMVTIAPTSGSHLSTTAVTVTGTSTNIDAALGVVTAVKFDLTNGTSFSWNSGTGTLAATAAIHAAGAVNVTLVGFPGGSLVFASGFTYT